MRYPGRVIKVGETDARIVKALKTALNKALVLRGSEAIVLEPDNPAFGPQMKQAVKLFQARHLDEQGQPSRRRAARTRTSKASPSRPMVKWVH